MPDEHEHKDFEPLRFATNPSLHRKLVKPNLHMILHGQKLVSPVKARKPEDRFEIFQKYELETDLERRRKQWLHE